MGPFDSLQGFTLQGFPFDWRDVAVVCDARKAVAAGSMEQAKAKGQIRVEGKDYVVREGDILHVRFAV